MKCPSLSCEQLEFSFIMRALVVYFFTKTFFFLAHRNYVFSDIVEN